MFCRTVEKYDVDGVLIEMDTALLAACAGAKVDYPPDEPARVLGIQLESIFDASKLKTVDFSKTRAMVVLEATERIVERIGAEFYIRGNCDQAAFSLSCLLRGTENFLMDLLTEEEEPIRALLEYSHQVSVDFMTLMQKTGVDMVSNGDSPAGPDMISPTMYRRWAFEYDKRLAEQAHSLGLPHLMHICGNTTAILDDMVATGTDVLELDYRTDIQAINRTTFGKCCFCGNVDPSGVLCLGTRTDVITATLELLRSQERNPKFILNAGCALPSITPVENIQTFILTAREFERNH